MYPTGANASLPAAADNIVSNQAPRRFTMSKSPTGRSLPFWGVSPGQTTTMPTGAAQFCYPGDQIRDITTPGAMAPSATVTSANGTTITVPNTAVIGGGIANNDVLECAAPGFAFGTEAEGYTTDQLHPWYPAQAAIVAADNNTFVKQLLGLQ